jgi:hypothetical protein
MTSPARLTHDHIAEAYIFAGDFVEVVQGGILHQHPADFDGF